MPDDIYSTQRVQALFAEMSRTYGVVNLVASFGFALRWRRQCVQRAQIQPGQTVYDLMAGMGECFPLIRAHEAGTVRGVDFCSEMCARARQVASRLELQRASGEVVLEEDVFQTSLEDNSADRIVCAFGLKTIRPSDLEALARQVQRLLKPGGRFSFVEISEPSNSLLRLTYVPYIRFLIPVVGFLLLGNPDNYRQLGVYTQRFRNTSVTREVFRNVGLSAEAYSLFFGCATGIEGSKPS